MASFLYMAVAFVLVLGAMIVIHELGHFLVAKFFGIRVEVFSVGFGKRIWGVKKGDTDYRLSLIPLGGYVKMAGENLDEQVTGAPDEFMSKPKWQRFFVAVAGPVMNIITALIIPAAMVMIHFETAAYINEPAVVSAVGYDSPAEKAGVKRGDLILSINGQENPTWRDVEDVIVISPNQEVPLTIKRNGEIIHTKLPIGERMIDQEKIGEAGLEAYYGPDTKLVTRAVAPGSPAEAAGFKIGDEILAINGKPVLLNERPATREVTPASDEETLFSQSGVIREIQNSEGRPVTLTVRRDGETLNLTATPQMDEGRQRLGFSPAPEDGQMIVSRLGPLDAFKYSWEMNLRILRLTGIAIQQIFVGQRSARDTFTGPVGIFVMSGQAAEQGPDAVFRLMAVLSLNLGVFNLLPIPVLDGGMIFMLGLEALLGLFGLQLTLRIKEKMIQVGFVMLLLLMGFVIFNDISKRIPSRSDPAPRVEQQQQQQQPADKSPSQK